MKREKEIKERLNGLRFILGAVENKNEVGAIIKALEWVLS